MNVEVKSVKKRYSRDKDIIQWATDRNIMKNGNRYSQCEKLEEEFMELCEALEAREEEDVKDAIGDMYVVMTLIAEFSGLTIPECVEHAYDTIKDRKGYLNEDGVFVKEE